MCRIHVAAAVIRRAGKVLLASRPAGKPPAGWEFPGGKIEPGETPAGALRRELEEELGVEVVPGDELYRLVTAPERGGIELIFLRALLAPEAVPVCREGQEYRWVELAGPPPEELLAPDRPGWNFLTNFQRPIQFFPPPAR